MAKTSTNAGKDTEAATAEKLKQIAAATGAVKGFDWDAAKGEESSGRGDVLEIEVGEVVGPLTINQIQENVFLSDEKNAKPVTCYGAKDPAGNPWRLPVSAIFVNNCVQLKIAVGDTIAIKRVEDKFKVRGQSKGTPMKDYVIKVLKRG